MKLQSTLFTCGPRERSLAAVAFPSAKPLGGKATDTATSFDVGGLVSRKKDFVPSITTAINAGWECPGEEDLSAHHGTELYVEEVAGAATVKRRKSTVINRLPAAPAS